MHGEPRKPRAPILEVSDAAKRGDIDYLINALADPEIRGSAALHLGDDLICEGIYGSVKPSRRSFET